jgi:hypothetical protein
MGDMRMPGHRRCSPRRLGGLPALQPPLREACDFPRQFASEREAPRAPPEPAHVHLKQRGGLPGRQQAVVGGRGRGWAEQARGKLSCQDGPKGCVLGDKRGKVLSLQPSRLVRIGGQLL